MERYKVYCITVYREWLDGQFPGKKLLKRFPDDSFVEVNTLTIVQVSG